MSKILIRISEFTIKIHKELPYKYNININTSNALFVLTLISKNRIFTHLSVPLVQDTRNLYFLSSHFLCDTKTPVKENMEMQHFREILCFYTLISLCCFFCFFFFK